MLFTCNFLLIFLSVSLVTSDDSFIPCQSYISFSYDDSDSLNSVGFKTQMSLIKSSIGSLNHPERLRAEGGYGSEFSWKSGLSIQQMQNNLNFAEQTSIPYSLLQQFSSLLTSFENLRDNNATYGAVILISDTSDAALKNADRLLPKLSQIRITFILLGSNVDSSKLIPFSSNIIFWPDLTQSQPNKWDYISYHAYGCDAPYISSSSPSIVSTVVPPTPGPYYPCQTWITVLADNSNSLTVDQFQKHLNLIKDILNSVSNYERVRYGAYNLAGGSINYPWNPSNNFVGLNAAIENTTQTSNAASLANAMTLLVANLVPNTTIPDSSVIFVSDTTNDFQITQAVNRYISILKPEGIRLTFILTGPRTDASHLSGFTDAVIFNWQSMENQQPDGWDILQAFRCSFSASTPATTPSWPSSTASATVPLTPGPYYPCQTWITFLADNSNSLTVDQFQKQLNFLKETVNYITNYERIRYGAYNLAVDKINYPWNPSNNLPGLKSAIDNTTQTSYNAGLYNAMSLLISNLIPNATIPDSTVIFVSDTSNSISITQALNRYNSILKPQGIRLTFILTGSHTDANQLSGFTDAVIFNWQNMENPRPDGWDLPQAFRCAIQNLKNTVM